MTALFAPRIFTTRPGQKSPTTLNDDSSSDKEEGINYTTVDWREFMCNTWHLEPTLRSETRAYHSLQLKKRNSNLKESSATEFWWLKNPLVHVY
jgi:hypothetical protein